MILICYQFQYCFLYSCFYKKKHVTIITKGTVPFRERRTELIWSCGKITSQLGID